MKRLITNPKISSGRNKRCTIKLVICNFWKACNISAVNGDIPLRYQVFAWIKYEITLCSATVCKT
jgi:hypothetical protein